MAEHRPASLLTLMAGGAVTVGFCTSFTVTVNEHESEPSVLVAVTITVVDPTGKLLPDTGE